MFRDSDTISKIIQSDPLTAYFLQKSGVDYLAYLDVTLRQTCLSLNKSTNKILDSLNFKFPNIYRRAGDFNQYTIAELCKYLRESHHEYIREKLPFIESKLKYLSGNDKSISALAKLFTKFKTRFIEHIDYEETKFFPYLDRLQFCKSLTETELYEIYLSTKCFSVDKFIKNHSPVEEEIYDLQSIFQSELDEKVDNIHVPIILSEIQALIDDLEIHAQIEDKILVGKAEELEEDVQMKMYRLASLN
ncbi:MAG: hypothetical protein IIA45_16010 [Bacteroidetes bacterium]|nr:hypothetical protein [Bacteroidota bacterium]